MSIGKLKKIHFTGIKGVGMTALAIYMKDSGVQVTGSDVEEYFVTDEALVKANIEWKVGFDEKNVDSGVDLVITTGAHGGLKNLEVVYAKKKGIKVLTYAEALAQVAKEKDLITVCGVGGKGTTASIISVMLDSAGLHPSFVIGMGEVYPIGTSGRFDKKGRHFICEADEYAISPGINNNPKFSLLNPKVLIVTNIEHDHPDIYPDEKSTLKTFRKFFERVPEDGLLIACIDNRNVKKIIESLDVPVTTYGFDKDADWVIVNVDHVKQKTRFKLGNGKVEQVELHVPGDYNVRNATAAYIAGHFLGVDGKNLKTGLSRYKGCRRRFEKMGDYKEAVFYDDYAHHPEEIKASLKAAKQWFPKRRIVAIFQPHTYSRTKALFKDFARSFGDADMVAIMDIYASAREKKDLNVTSKHLAKETLKHHKYVGYSKGHKETLSWLGKHIKKGDVVLTMGAGDIFHLYKNMF